MQCRAACESMRESIEMVFALALRPEAVERDMPIDPVVRLAGANIKMARSRTPRGHS